MKHEKLIRAALDGKTIQSKHKADGDWITFSDKRLAVAHMSAEYPTYEYRVAPKPDRVLYARLLVEDDELSYSDSKLGVEITETRWSKRKAGSDNIKATFDGETGKLKSIELLEK